VAQKQAKPCRLDLVEPRVVANLGVPPLILGAVEAQAAGAGIHLRITGDHRSPVAEPAQVLGREEAEDSRVAQGARHAPLERGAVSLGGVLEDLDPARMGQLEQLGDGRRIPEQMHGQ
jgi:hypothetical protein